MRPPAALIRAGVHNLPCIGDGRQSGTSYSPSILNAAPEAAVGGGLALLETGDRVRIDLKRRRADVRSEEHTSELQSLMRISYAVFCLKKKKQTKINTSEVQRPN